jgi:hypothetical protein
MRWLFFACLVGCAQAGAPGGAPIDANEGGHTNTDSGFGMHPDAPMRPIDAAVAPIDAPPGMTTQTLDQNTTDTLAGDTSVACGYTGLHIGTKASKYYRVFPLSSFGITTAFHLSSAAFQVEDCESNDADCTSVTIDVGTYSPSPGAKLTGTFTQIASTSATIPLVVEDQNGNTPGGTVTATFNPPALIPANSNLYFEIDAPDGEDTYQLYVGGNAAGENGLSYTSSSCAGSTPVDIATTTGATPPPNIDLLMTVTGTY